MLNAVDARFIAKLAGVLPDGTLGVPEPRHLEEPRGRFTGQGGVLARPRRVEEVATILHACHAGRVGVVTLGGGTGLVGGQVMPEGPAPLILSMERMTRIRAVYPDENVLIAEAGAILADVRTAAHEADRLFPLMLASEGSCRIGGNLGTNAGGVNVLRYGNARDLCLGLEAVLPDGQIWNGLSRLRKDNTGYDLRNLLIGAEGTLGVITAAALRLFPVPRATGAALIAVESPAAALDLLALAQAQLGEGVSSFELIHRMGFDFLDECAMGLRPPLDPVPEWSVLIDIGLVAALDPADALGRLFEAAADAGLVSDGVIAANEAQRHAFWTLREMIPEANKRIGAIASHDISLPLSEIPAFVAEAPAALARFAGVRINCFGHLGDGNLHYNLFPPAGQGRAAFDGIKAEASGIIHDMVMARGGSFSAEHGVGRLKLAELQRYGDPGKLAAMRAIKAALDPHGIMNPGALLG